MTSRPTEMPTLEVHYANDGLVPVVVQDAHDGRVLMVAYMDAEGLAATLSTGDVHFHSRRHIIVGSGIKPVGCFPFRVAGKPHREAGRVGPNELHGC